MGTSVIRKFIESKNFIVYLVIILVFVHLIIFALPYLFTNYFLGISFHNTGEIGETLGGILTPFIAIVASFLTFLAFWVQYQANQEQKKQFEIQNQDQLFFKLMEAQLTRIINSNIKFDENIISGYQLTEKIVNSFYNQIRIENRSLAREYIRNHYQDMSDINFSKMFEAIGIPISRYEAEKEKFINEMNRLSSNDRWEYIKKYFGSLNNESKNQLEALEQIGSVLFYKVDFEIREQMYNNALYQIETQYGIFIDGYYKGIEFILDLMNKSSNEIMYVQYFKSQLSKFEVVLIFYYLASQKCSKELAQLIQKYKLFDGLVQYNNLLMDLPSMEEIEKELIYIIDSKKILN